MWIYIYIYKHLCARLLVIVTIRSVLFSGHFDSAIEVQNDTLITLKFFHHDSISLRQSAAQTIKNTFVSNAYQLNLVYVRPCYHPHFIPCSRQSRKEQSLQACQISPAGKRLHRVVTVIWRSQREKRRSRECPSSSPNSSKTWDATGRFEDPHRLRRLRQRECHRQQESWSQCYATWSTCFW